MRIGNAETPQVKRMNSTRVREKMKGKREQKSGESDPIQRTNIILSNQTKPNQHFLPDLTYSFCLT